MNESEHYEVAIRQCGKNYEAVLKLNIGDIKHIQTILPLKSNCARCIIRMDHEHYSFYVLENGQESFLGKARCKYLSSEVSSGFTGVLLGLYATGDNTAEFSEYRYVIQD